MRNAKQSGFFKSTVLCSSLILLLVSCSDKPLPGPKNKSGEQGPPTQTGDANNPSQPTVIKINAQMQAPELVAAGENLLSPQTLALADKAFELAAEKNKDDKKIQFYRLLTKRYLIFKGIVNRLKPLAEKTDSVDRLNTFINGLPNKNLKEFLTIASNEQSLLHSEAEVQNVVKDYRIALIELQSFIKSVRSLSPIWEVPAQILPFDFLKSTNAICAFSISDSKEGFQADINCDGVVTTRKVTLNIADLLVLQEQLNAELFASVLLTSYDLTGLSDFMKESATKPLSKKGQLEFFIQKVNLTLLKDHGLGEVRNIGSSLNQTLNWVKEYQSGICPTTNQNPNPTRENNLYPGSLCVTEASPVNKLLAQLEMALKNTPIEIPLKIQSASETTSTEQDQKQDQAQDTRSENTPDQKTVQVEESKNQPEGQKLVDVEGIMKGNTKVIKVQPFAFFDRPVQNLSELLNFEWNAKGSEITQIKNKSLNGMLPDQDADELLKIIVAK